MQAPRLTWKPRRLALVCAALAAAFTAFPAYAQEDELPDAKLFRELLVGLGVRGGNGPEIDYRERSPLVVPPSMSLPKPETKTAADRASNWPTDYDVRRRRELAAAREKAERPDVFRDSGPARDSDPLSPDQMAPGRANRPSRGSTSGPYHPTNESGAPYSPSALGYVGGIFDSMFGGDKEEYKPFTGEPPRTGAVYVE